MAIPKGDKALMSKAPIVEIPVNKCCDWQGFSYTTKGWHYLCETMKEIEKNPRLHYKDSILYRYYTHYQPRSILECFFINQVPKLKNQVDLWPPLPWKRTMSIAAGNHQHFGPNHDRFGATELQRIISVYKTLKKNGYRPAKYKDGYIKGYFLKKPGDYRFLVTSGQHRIAALAVLGYKDILVRVQRRHERFVTIKEAEKWPQVVNGTYDKELARRIFQSYFKSNGREKAVKFGLTK